MRYLLAAALLAAVPLAARAQVPAAAPAQPDVDKPTAYAAKSPVPVYYAPERNLGKYYLYADGGFHADWYVGYNNCWIVKLPPIPSAGYAKAFIGAKLGRAKVKSWPASWDTAPIPGKVYMALNQEPTFNSDHTYFLVEAADLPREPLPNDSLEGVDSARWLWSEIPPSRVSSEKDNYLALWSSSRFFTSASSSPIISAALGENDEEGGDSVWLNRSIKGNAPSGEGVLETSISGLKPAMAIKLVPANDYKVFIKGFSAELDAESITASFTAIGEDIRATWLEVSYDKFDWQRVTRYMYKAPYFWTFGRDEISKEMFYLRAAALDNLENTGYSKEITVPAVAAAAKPQ